MVTKTCNREWIFVTLLKILQKCQCETTGNITQCDFNFIPADTDSLSQVHLFFIVYST